MNIIYAHCRLSVNDANKWNEDVLSFDEPTIPTHVHEVCQVFSKANILFYTVNDHTDLSELAKYKNVKTFVHENTSFDFGIYKTGFKYIFDNGLEDNTIIMNDGCMVLKENMYRLNNAWMNHDFTGACYNYTWEPKHLQSFFILFTKRMLDDQRFKDFWQKNIQYGWTKGEAIHRGETQITDYFVGLGYTFGYFTRFNGNRFAWGDTAHLRANTPILKIKMNERLYKNRYIREHVLN